MLQRLTIQRNNWLGVNIKWICIKLIFLFLTDIPAQVPPLTPGTNKKMTEALKASYATWDKELPRHNIPRGRYFLNPHICITLY